MPYIDTVMQEGTVMDDLKTILTANGWTYKLGFKKYAYPSTIASPGGSAPSDSSKVKLAIARHMIFENVDGVLYGIAKVRNFEETYGDLTVVPRTDDAGFRLWLADQYKDFTHQCALHFYMLDAVPTNVLEGGAFGCAVDVDPERGAVDIEVINHEFVVLSGSTPTFRYTEFDENIQQSPFVKSTLRNSNLQTVAVETNWWPDSLIRVKGLVDTKTVFLVVQADSTPAFRNNVVPTVPIYFGAFVSFKEADVGNQALWAGTAFDSGAESQSHTFDFKSTDPYRVVANYLPIRRKYPNFPGNGIDNIIVKRSELGARYQAYFLSWNVAPQMMPPDRVGKDGGQYPLSWTTSENEEYTYQFNPSVYGGKIHTSHAYIIHPDEGVRGYLPKMVILSPLGLVNDDKLKVRTATCPDQFDIYRFFLTSAISPVSKRPGTAYTPAGIGIYEKSE